VRTLAAGVLLAVCGPPALAQSQTETTEDAVGASINGVASYREQMALPPGAVFEATIEDVSRADAPSTVIGKTVIDNPMPPIHFTIPFDPADIAPERRYAVRARILVNGHLRFTSDRIHPVLTGGAGRSVDIPLKSVGGSGPRPTSDHPRSATAQPTSMAAAESAYIPAHGLRLPATFRGDLPCADCEAVRHHLDLWPDQVFHLRREWLGKEPIIGNTLRADIGRWRIDPGRRALVLHGGTEMPLQFRILGADRLRQLDLAGKPIESDLPYALNSDGTLDPTDLSLFMAGETTYQADSAQFTECLTGRSYPIAPGSEARRLQRSYLADVEEPGANLYVTFDGAIANRPGMKGEGFEPQVTVERFVGTWPGQSCTQAKAEASLVNTYWRIVWMHGEAIDPVPGRREPYLLLRQSDDDPGYAATVGCNQLIGQFETAADGLSFSRAASTLMACPPPLAEMEQQLVAVLDGTRRWRILDDTLSLKNAAGDDLARLEAAYF
jgi:uncharacterized lipoprotein YbaY/heat shock protein HslJ